MLVLTMTKGDRVLIGDPADPLGWIEIPQIRSDRARIAWEFPRSVAVHREAVARSILAQLPHRSLSPLASRFLALPAAAAV